MQFNRDDLDHIDVNDARPYRVRQNRLENNGNRRTIELEFEPVQDEEALLAELMYQAVAVADYAEGAFIDMQNNQNLILSVVLESSRGVRILPVNPNATREQREARRAAARQNPYQGNQRDRFRINRKFRTAQEIRDNLARSILQTLEDLAQSGGEFEVPVVQLRFDYADHPELVAHGKAPRSLISAIHDSNLRRGLYEYTAPEGYCGWMSVLMFLVTTPQSRIHWRGDLTELENEQNKGASSLLRRLKQPRLALSLSRFIAEQVCPGNHKWVVGPFVGSTAEAFVRAQPKFQIVIIHTVTRQVYERRIGADFDNSIAAESTIVMGFTLQHLHLIKSMGSYLGSSLSRFCYNCLKMQRWENHVCENRVRQCGRCLLLLRDEAHEEAHMKKDRQAGVNPEDDESEVVCPKCDKDFYNQNCLTCHRCRASHIAICEQCDKKIFPGQNHVCGHYRCVTCLKDVPPEHRCFMLKLDEPETETAEQAGKHYWAFDLESMFVPEDNGANKHVVNLIVLRRVFGDEELIFWEMQDFVSWMERLRHSTTLFAHNLKGYDGRMVFDYLFDKHYPPQNIMWQGSKIMSMEFGKVSFKDTLLHLPSSLEGLPKMFGLDEKQFKKGFFPYKFNTNQHQAYVGEWPSKEWYEPHMMSPKKKKEFELWHAAQVGKQYNFRRELLEYCQSDVKILAQAIKAYMTHQMSKKPMDPFSCLTIASYAMKLFRVYYMPENLLCVLNSLEHDLIGRSMHGGRTDARRLLKEWSKEEVAAGYYGRYQDVQSLYPAVQFFDPLPVGAPEYTRYYPGHQPTRDTLLNLFGFVCCDIEPTKYLHHPVIVELDVETGRLLADLKPKTQIVIPSPELHLALKNGYSVTHVYWTYKYESSTEIFKSYFMDHLKTKLEASGLSEWAEEHWETFRQEHIEKLGITLDKPNMVANAALKAGAKLLCNSLWGKFGERSKRSVWGAFMRDGSDEAIMALENKWLDGDIDVMFRKYSGDGEAVGMVYMFADDMPSNALYEKRRRANTNIALASMITSHARCRLWTELNKLGNRVLYHDTDSIIYENDPAGYNIPEGRYLGEWESEEDHPITKFASTGPKCYSYMTQDAEGVIQSTCTKVKGITQNSNNTALINFESMKALVTGEKDIIRATCLSFKYDRMQGAMTTENVIKLFKKTYSKGEIMQDYKVYPFGYERFPQEYILY